MIHVQPKFLQNNFNYWNILQATFLTICPSSSNCSLNFQVSRWNIYFWFVINLAYTKSIIYFFMRHFPIWNWINTSSKCKNLYASQRGIRTLGCPNNTYFCYRERLFVLTGHFMFARFQNGLMTWAEASDFNE